MLRLYLLSLFGRAPMGMIALLVVPMLEHMRGRFTVAVQFGGALAIGLGAISPLRWRLPALVGSRTAVPVRVEVT
ncbi:hypothetical protein ABZU76_07845 [Amycolatopsis sp. NPDC005232]|uniref:hypothetical protein n=1 Tax=Amycolatopsis sp. NPDC005232 TaxID=3157027 RepID=UPI0033BB0215